jgi:hypothetical protein
VELGSEVERFGRVTSVTDKGVEFSKLFPPWDPREDALRAASRSKDGGAYVPGWPSPKTVFVRFGEAHKAGYYCNSTTVIPRWGLSGSPAAFIEITREGQQKH